MFNFLLLMDVLAAVFGFWSAGHFAASSFLHHKTGQPVAVHPSMHIILVVVICYFITRTLS